MMQSLKHSVRQHFEQRALSSDQLDRLEALMQAPAAEPHRRHRLATPWTGWSVAAALAAVFALVMLLPTSQLDGVPMTERIAREVARNHIKLKPLDVTTDSMDGIRRYFTDLEFVPVESRLLAGQAFDLLGGRYCSVQSIPAAQLRLSPRDNDRPRTLYQAEYQPVVFGKLPMIEQGETPVSVNVKGITVRIWVEKGLLFVLTEEGGLESIDSQ